MTEPILLSLLALLAMGAVTILPRVGGFWLMGRVTITPRLRRMLEALPGSIVLAIVLPVVFKAGPSGVIAIVAAGAVMFMLRNQLVALGVGVGVAVLLRLAGI